MYEVFTTLLNMSMTAGILVLIIILLRLCFKKAPKKYVCILWALVALRLLCPFSISSSLSIFNLINMETDSSGQINYFQYNGKTEKPILQFDVPAFVNNNTSAESMTIGTHTSNLYLPTIMYIWTLGVVIMLAYAVICYLQLKKQVTASAQKMDNIYICDDIKFPFILGIIKPRIFLPSGMKENTEKNVIAHEVAHLKRHDHLWKPLGYLLLSVYWFNPVLWFAYILLCRDIEAACDEMVISEMDKNSIAEYSEALLSCATHRRIITACPIAFGETNVKGRIKHVLTYKKPAFWIICITIVACIIAAVCLLTNPDSNKTLNRKAFDNSYIIGQQERTGRHAEKYFGTLTETSDVIPCVMVNGELYFHTGNKSKASVRCGTMDGNIDRECSPSEYPTENNQGNFGTGYEYQYGPVEGTIEILLDDEWNVFATEKVLASSEVKVTNSAEDTMLRFFAHFQNADYAAMAELCTKSCQDTFFHDGDVFGYKWASVDKYTEKIIDKQTYKYQVNVQMETTPQSALYPETETTFSVHVVYENGVWLVNNFTTD